MDINVYDARKIVAKANSHGTSNWVDLKITELDCGIERENEITLFFAGPDAKAIADRLAAAINGANAVVSFPVAEAAE